MEYFDVHNMPAGLLRAKFETASPIETEKLGEIFTPVVAALMPKASKSQKLRIGFQTFKKNNGKTTLARRMAECVSDGKFPDIMLNGWSNKYNVTDEASFLHFDVAAIETAKNLYPSDNLSMRMRREFSQHDVDYSDACMHLVEWPERDKRNPNLNIHWQLARTSYSQCQLALSSTDEITELPEFQQFLEDAAPFMIK